MIAALFMSLATFLVVYMVKFSDDFKKEDIDKVTPLIAVVVIFAILTFVMSNMG
jgi:hypothetical protein